MFDFSPYGVAPSEILIPRAGIDLSKWSVVACDQFTSQAEYWENTEKIVGGAPSTLRMIYPECYMKARPAEPEKMHAAMRSYLDGALSPAPGGFVLVERETTAGLRIGLVAAVDLEAYDYHPGAKPLIRATEGTVRERIPPRAKVRRGAPLETPHAMLLADDPRRLLIEPLYAARDAMPKLYDFDLMQNGGHLRGWAVGEEYYPQMLSALSALRAARPDFLFAVGDGNHSLATARACWQEISANLSPEEREIHPAHWTLTEICNLHDPSLVFEPIHRAVFGANAASLRRDFVQYCRAKGMSLIPCAEAEAELFLSDEPLRIENAPNPLPVAVVQAFLDEWIGAHPGASLDYIHGRDALSRLDVCRIRLTAMDKSRLFPAVESGGVLPRKTFSMGEARDKRYYLECRRL